MNYSEILAKHGFTFAKKYGQNFLVDPQLLAAVARDGADKNDNVLEIGAGAGALTRALALLPASVVAYEIDERLRPVLAETLQGTDARVVFADVLKGGEAPFHAPYRIVANLPYYITTPVIFRFLYDPDLLSLTIMVQKEVAERIVAAAGTPEYGALSAQMQLMGSVRITRYVPRSLFVPAPQVDSAVVRLDVSPKIERREIDDYRRLVAAAFAMRRKTLANNLCAAFPLSKQTAQSLVEKVCGKPDARGETFSPEMFIRLMRLGGI